MEATDPDGGGETAQGVAWIVSWEGGHELDAVGAPASAEVGQIRLRSGGGIHQEVDEAAQWGSAGSS